MTERREDQHQRFLETPPSATELAAVVSAIAPGARVRSVTRLPGGIASAVHRVDLERPDSSVVVRRFNDALPWHRAERVKREATLLGALEATPVPAPSVLLADADGSATGCPMLVLSLLPGRSIDPPGDDAWAEELATTLATIHDQSPPFDAEDWITFWRSADALPDELGAHPRAQQVWSALVHVRDELIDERWTLAHHDFHPGNTLWSDGHGRPTVSGVVDWPLAGGGYAAYDAVYCAFDTSLSKGPAAGERFLRAYESIVGRTLHPGWRLVVATRALDELDDWLDAYLGVGTALSLGELHANFDAWLDAALQLTT
ncbi:MAG TPA: aminoglycoside phosphotransferase family protein [Acidimicrobiales bacterium]|nr:aminoglycoside phosphotransferase family protein [Acidimicrobiales bacterium]